MAQTGYNQYAGTPENRAINNQPTHSASLMFSEEEMAADADEPPDLERTPRPSALKLHDSFKGSFSKRAPQASDRKESLLTSALHSDSNSPVDDAPETTGLRRGMSSASSWSNHSASTAELTSDGGLTSPGTRTRSPSPPLPRGMLHSMVPVFNKTSFEQSISIVRHYEDENIGPLQKISPNAQSKETDAEAYLARRRCIKFACGPPKETTKPIESTKPQTQSSQPEPAKRSIKFACGAQKETSKPTEPSKSQIQISQPEPAKRSIKFACGTQKEAPKPTESTKPQIHISQPAEPAKRVTTIKFACPAKVSSGQQTLGEKPRTCRAVSPAPLAHRSRSSPKPAPKVHRGSDSTVRNASPVSTRKLAPAKDRIRRLSVNSDLARCEAYRFHEFASSEEEEDEWLQESTCHRSRLTVDDTLKIENTLRKLGEEAEEEALDDDEDDDEDDAEMDDDDDDDDDEDEDDEDDEEEEEEAVEDGEVSDAGFQTDDEEGFAGSDDESDAGSDFAWWTPGARPGPGSTAATSVDALDYIRPTGRRSPSESSLCSVNSKSAFEMPTRPLKGKKSRPVNIRVPSPELPDSTDFVCGTLDEDRPLEEEYMSVLERRRAAKHKLTPQDIDPTFPTSDPEMDEEDDDEEDGPDRLASESDHHLMMHGQMDAHHDPRGRVRAHHPKRSPAVSPKRLRSPPPPVKRVHRSPPPRKLFGQSPKRMQSPAPRIRLRSPPPTRRGSAQLLSPRRPGVHMALNGLAERPALTTSSSLPRTPVTVNQPDCSDDEDTACELPVSRRAIDIKIGLEKKRQRRKEQQYRKTHRKGAKDKKPPPGKGYERMREMGLGLAAHKGKNIQYGLGPYGFGITSPPDQKDMHVLSV